MALADLHLLRYNGSDGVESLERAAYLSRESVAWFDGSDRSLRQSRIAVLQAVANSVGGTDSEEFELTDLLRKTIGDPDDSNSSNPAIECHLALSEASQERQLLETDDLALDRAVGHLAVAEQIVFKADFAHSPEVWRNKVTGRLLALAEAALHFGRRSDSLETMIVRFIELLGATEPTETTTDLVQHHAVLNHALLQRILLDLSGDASALDQAAPLLASITDDDSADKVPLVNAHLAALKFVEVAELTGRVDLLESAASALRRATNRLGHNNEPTLFRSRLTQTGIAAASRTAGSPRDRAWVHIGLSTGRDIDDLDLKNATLQNLEEL